MRDNRLKKDSLSLSATGINRKNKSRKVKMSVQLQPKLTGDFSISLELASVTLNKYISKNNLFLGQLKLIRVKDKISGSV